MVAMKPSEITAGDIQEYAGRDWSLAARAKEEHWIAQRAAMTVGEALSLADGLRQFAKEVQPGWPTAADREEDFAAHERLARWFELAAKHTTG
jgi:hypothetical protein